ncbi:fasciclin-2-like isoform X2 [Planococcus citri]|uniref:fasciclin-2-like isoform X2 n=1 Tax=Planococcus citri TaxID=170843 RepID=UPI0031F77AEC
MDSKMRSILGIYCLILYTVAVFSAEISIKPIEKRQLKALGQDHVFTCVITGDRSNIANFRWIDPRGNQIDANYRKANPRIFSPSISSSGTQLQLLINKLTKEDGGQYSCRADYGAEALVANVTVDPYQTITFTNAPTDQSAQIGTRYKVKCQVEAMPPPTVEWTRNNMKLQNNQLYVLEADGLVINNVAESDDGEYRCEVMVIDTGEVKSRVINLEVVAPPKITNNRDIIWVTEGEKAQIVCNATGKPKPTITWTKANTKQEVSKGTDGILYIEKVIRDDTTDYDCKAENKAGEQIYHFHLSVRSKPEVFDVKNGTSRVGEFGQIQCHVYGNPKPSVIIRKFSAPRTTRSAEELRTIVETIDHPTRKHSVIATMNFTKVELIDDGLYECAAQNDVGTSVRSVHLTVQYPPIIDPAVNINQTFSWDRRPVNLTCVAEAIPNATIAWYFNNRIIERNDQTYRIYGKGSPSTLQVTPLDRSAYGIYKCRADNELGQKEWTINLKEAFPPQPVDNFEVNTTTATSITFKIQDPMETGGLPVKGYVVQYITEPQQWNEASNETWARGALYSIHDLLPARRYTFRFAAINEVGLSRWGKQETRQMPDQSPPSEPIITNAIDDGAKFIKLDTAKQFELKWKIPSSNGLDIDSYMLRYCVASEDEKNDLFPITSACVEKTLGVNEVLSSYTIKDLTPDTYYVVQLRAHNGMGDGPHSEKYFKTSISTEPVPAGETRMSSAVLIYIVVAILIAVLVIVDVFCFFFGKTGVLYLICGACCGKKNKNSDDKLGRSQSSVMLVPTNYVTVMTLLSDSETKDLISNGHKKIDIEEQAPMINNTDGSKKDTAVEYDVKKGTSRTGFVGKDSAV